MYKKLRNNKIFIKVLLKMVLKVILTTTTMFKSFSWVFA